MGFNIGDVVTGKPDNNTYGYTSVDSICVVLNVYGDTLDAMIIAHFYDDTLSSDGGLIGTVFTGLRADRFVIVDSMDVIDQKDRMDLVIEEL